ncbi:putative O-acyltransferase WSD1 [Helianthus debilis subsp. tardiflorus]
MRGAHDHAFTPLIVTTKTVTLYCIVLNIYIPFVLNGKFGSLTDHWKLLILHYKLGCVQAVGKLNHRVFFNTTLWFSNVPGPQQEVTFYGHDATYIAPSCYGQPNALMIHIVSYIDKVTFVISADEETIPDPHRLGDDLEKSLQQIKASATAKES